MPPSRRILFLGAEGRPDCHRPLRDGWECAALLAAADLPGALSAAFALLRPIWAGRLDPHKTGTPSGIEQIDAQPISHCIARCSIFKAKAR